VIIARDAGGWASFAAATAADVDRTVSAAQKICVLGDGLELGSTLPIAGDVTRK
jgi:hypothetical protein